MSSFNSATEQPTIGVAGDWHFDLNWALNALDLYAERKITTIIHLGDFGIMPAAKGTEYIKRVSQRVVTIVG
jgi:predicted phosphodiesterase